MDPHSTISLPSDLHLHQARAASAIPSLLIGVDPEGRITRWNREAERTLGRPWQEALGAPLEELGLEWPGTGFLRELARHHASDLPLQRDNVRFRAPGGREALLNLVLAQLQGGDGRITGFLIFGLDVTERRALEIQLAQTQKLESMGRLAAGIAHEINTPTQYISDNTHFLQEAFESLCALVRPAAGALVGSDADASSELPYLLEEIPRAIRQSLEGLDRVTRIARAMKEFSHPGSSSRAPGDLNRIVENTVTVARNEWKYVAELALDLERGLPAVPCLSNEIAQVVLNLVVNAAHAIADVVGQSGAKGTITIRTRSAEGGVELTVSDTGPGIPEAIRPRIFEPFFTTKEPGRGTGQGLVFCRCVVVDKHQGTIGFETAVGQGTSFRVWLPL